MMNTLGGLYGPPLLFSKAVILSKRPQALFAAYKVSVRRSFDSACAPLRMTEGYLCSK